MKGVAYGREQAEHHPGTPPGLRDRDRLSEENPTAGWVILNGNRIQIKRKQFEKIIDSLDSI